MSYYYSCVGIALHDNVLIFLCSCRLQCTTPDIMKQLKLQSLHVAMATTVIIHYVVGEVPDHNSDKQFFFTVS